MPLFMDRHDLTNATPEELAQAHICDLNVQDKYGVRFVTYWFHRGAANGLCLLEAPAAEAAMAAHREAHGNLACQMVEVDWSSVEGFLGPVHEPVAGEPWEALGRRTIVSTRLDDARLPPPGGRSLIRRSLEARGGYSVAGDTGVIGCFPSTVAAMEYALAMQRSFVPLASLYERAPVRVRIGIGIGEPLTEGFGLFGEASTVAAGLCETAGPGEILAPSELRRLSGTGGFVFEDRGLISIDGLQRPLHYCALTAVRAGAAMRSSAPLPGAAPCGLSTRELEVLRLMAVGKTNLEIAEMLFISHSTVTSHVRSIFNKTSVANRAEAASFAYRHRLVGADDVLA